MLARRRFYESSAEGLRVWWASSLASPYLMLANYHSDQKMACAAGSRLALAAHLHVHPRVYPCRNRHLRGEVFPWTRVSLPISACTLDRESTQDSGEHSGTEGQTLAIALERATLKAGNRSRRGDSKLLPGPLSKLL